MIKTAFLAFVEQRVNGLLELDPVTLKRLQALDGSVIRVSCWPPDFECFIFLDNQGVRCAGYHEGEVTATFTGSLSAFTALSLNRHSGWESMTGLEVTGDPVFLDQLLAAHQGMDLDWESVFCDYLGTVPGHAVAESIRYLTSQFKQTESQVSAHLSEYLQEELNVVPSQSELSNFCREVSSLQEAVTHLENKIKQTGEHH